MINRPALKGHKPPFSRRVIKEAKDIGFYPYFLPVSGRQGHIVEFEGRRTIMLGSNNYLGMTENEEVREAAKSAIDKYGVGCTGSRYLNGTLSIHLEIEDLLAEFMGTEKALIFSSGYHTNVGTIYSLASESDMIFSDQYNHASIVDGCRMSKAEVLIYDHNDPVSLEAGFRTIPADRPVLFVSDGIFSMEGSIARYPELRKVCRENGAFIMMDDAHSIGVLGPRGNGTAAHFGSDVDITMGTFSKSMASMGGFISGNEDVIDDIKHTSRALIFSAAPPPSNVAAAMKSLELFMSDQSYKNQLWRNAEYLKKGFKDLGLDTGVSETPIIPVILGEEGSTVLYWRELLNRGIYTNPVIYPATPKDRNLLRNSVMATHTIDDLNQALDMYEKVMKEFPIEG
jgi:8-amino-7-oxononanoate synthase